MSWPLIMSLRSKLEALGRRLSLAAEILSAAKDLLTTSRQLACKPGSLLGSTLIKSLPLETARQLYRINSSIVGQPPICLKIIGGHAVKHDREPDHGSAGRIKETATYQRVACMRDSRNKFGNEFTQLRGIAFVLGVKIFTGSYDRFRSGFSDPPVDPYDCNRKRWLRTRKRRPK
jgi:hypothetical protein